MRVIKLVTLMILIMVVSAAAAAQDTFRFSAHYEDSQIPLMKKSPDDVVKGLSIEADLKLFKLRRFRGSVAYEGERRYDVEVYPNYFDGMNIVDLYRNVTAHYAGAQLGIDLGRVEPFIGYFVGTSKVHEDAKRQVVSKVRIGANLFVFTHVFLKAAIDFNRPYGSPNHSDPMLNLPAGAFVNPETRLIIVGAGFRF